MGIVSEIQSLLEEARTLKVSLFKKIGESLLQIGKPQLESEKLPGHAETINQVEARLTGLLNLSQILCNDKMDFTLVSYDYLNKFKSSIQLINTLQSDTINSLNSLSTIVGIDESNFVVTGNNGNAFALGQQLINIDHSTDRALERYYQIAPALSDLPQSFSSFTADLSYVLDDIKKIRAETEKEANEIRTIKKQINEYSEIASSQEEEILKILEKISKSEEDASASKNNIESFEKDLSDTVPQVQKLREDAKILKEKVDAYQTIFDDFNQALKTRIDTNNKGQAELQSLLKELKAFKENFSNYDEDKKKEVENLIKKADEMLGISTSASLGKIFKEQAIERGKEIKAHYKLILAYAIGIVIAAIWAAVEMGDNFDLGIFAFKLSIILPLAFMITLSVKTLRKLEKAKEHYEHKASLAVASEGYRRLYEGSERIKEQTSLLNNSFKEILRDPTEGLQYSNTDDDTVMGTLERFADVFVRILKEKKA